MVKTMRKWKIVKPNDKDHAEYALSGRPIGGGLVAKVISAETPESLSILETELLELAMKNGNAVVMDSMDILEDFGTFMDGQHFSSKGWRDYLRQKFIKTEKYW
jgi:hypothetical protein